MKEAKRHILPVIVIAQFCCTSLWFASNGVMAQLIEVFQLPLEATGHLTSAVQFGFIAGTLLFAMLAIADRNSPSRVFLICALLGATFNLFTIYESHSFYSLLGIRFLTGFFLAGIYPVGMKIASDYFQKGLGKSLGYLVGALVLGTAFPHYINYFTTGLPWKYVIFTTSILAVFGGGIIILFVPDGPFRSKAAKLKLSAWLAIFKISEFRKAAFGYFGHMWELYTFWAFTPFILLTYNESTGEQINIPIWSFIIIGSGSLACIIGGYISQKTGTKNTAATFLFLSGICCLLAPFILNISSPVVVLSFLIFWGCVVIADSPLFSTLVAQSAPAELKGTALTITNCIGFAITIISIQVLTLLVNHFDSAAIFSILALGPLFGLVALFGKKQ